MSIDYWTKLAGGGAGFRTKGDYLNCGAGGEIGIYNEKNGV